MAKQGVYLVVDMHITNAVGSNPKSESWAKSAMSAIRTVLRKATGNWQPEMEQTKQVMAMGRQISPIKPKYSRSCDLLPIIVDIAEANYDGLSGLKRQVVDCLFLWRLMTARRTDCATKWDVRSSDYTLLVGEHGVPVKRPGDASRMDIRIKDPKDPKKIGQWSYWISVHRIRPHLLFDKNIRYLNSYDKIDHLDLFWQLQQLQDRMSDKYRRSPSGHTFISATIEDSAIPRRLGSQRLQNMLRDRFLKFDIKMIKNENPGGTEDGSAEIRGHYIRGHVESVVFQLANKMQMGFSPMDMVYQAGHSESTFESSYSRPLVPRQELAVRSHPRRGELSIEEVQLK